MPYYKAQHEVFIRAVIRHGDQHLAYRQAYPKATKESAYTAAIRLLRQPHIAQRVAGALRQHALLERERERERLEHQRRMAEEDTLQKRIWLARVVRGEVMKQRYMQFRGRTILLHDTLSPFIILAAIELDTKYEYGYCPKIILDRQFARLYARATRPIGKNTSIASKKLTDLNVNPRPAMHPASNIPAVCNKIEGRPVRTTIASVTPAQTKTVISNVAERSVAQRETISLRPIKNEMNEVISREHAMGCIAELQEISPYGRNDECYLATSDTAELQEISRYGRNDECYLATSDTIQSGQSVNQANQRFRQFSDTAPTKVVISNEVQRSGTKREISREHVVGCIAELQEISPYGRNDECYLATSDIAELQEISPYGRNDECYLATSDIAEPQEISPYGRNDGFDDTAQFFNP